MVQESGQPVDMENVPLFTRFYKSSGFCLFALPTSGIHLFWGQSCILDSPSIQNHKLESLEKDPGNSIYVNLFKLSRCSAWKKIRSWRRRHLFDPSHDCQIYIFKNIPLERCYAPSPMIRSAKRFGSETYLRKSNSHNIRVKQSKTWITKTNLLSLIFPQAKSYRNTSSETNLIDSQLHHIWVVNEYDDWLFGLLSCQARYLNCFTSQRIINVAGKGCNIDWCPKRQATHRSKSGASHSASQLDQSSRKGPSWLLPNKSQHDTADGRSLANHLGM